MMNITAGIYKGRKILAPDEKITRPTLAKTREAIFSCLYSLIDFQEKNFLDMFSGSGIMGLEAISRGFNATSFEKNPKAMKIIKENYKSLGIEPDIKLGDSLKLIKKVDKKFDVIYIDPPYFSGTYENSLEAINESGVLAEDGIVILEHVTEIAWESFDYHAIKQKNYSQKSITFLNSCKRD